MQGSPTSQSVPYIATVEDVAEIALHGTADAEFWKTALAAERLVPYLEGGRAQIVVSAISARWMGIPFRELTFAAAVAGSGTAAESSGFFLFAAGHSSRILAWMERAFFRTPYRPAAIELDREGLTGFALRDGVDLLLEARREVQGPPMRSGPDSWEGRIFLPGGAELLFAKLAGDTQAFAFTPGRDRLELGAGAGHPAVRLLRESGFAAAEWRVRRSAVHARSKTVPR